MNYLYTNVFLSEIKKLIKWKPTMPEVVDVIEIWNSYCEVPQKEEQQNIEWPILFYSKFIFLLFIYVMLNK